MRPDEASRSTGKVVRDIYGRYVGVLSCFTVDSGSKVTWLGLDLGNGRLGRYEANRFVTSEEGALLIPEWKLQTEGMGGEMSTVRKRLEALKTLGEEGEVSGQVYDELTNRYSGQLKSLQERHKQICIELERRLHEIDEEVSEIELFLIEAKIQFRSGEMDDQSYQLVSGNCTSLKAKNLQEKEELQRALRSSEEIDVMRVTMTIGPQGAKQSN